MGEKPQLDIARTWKDLECCSASLLEPLNSVTAQTETLHPNAARPGGSEIQMQLQPFSREGINRKSQCSQLPLVPFLSKRLRDPTWSRTCICSASTCSSSDRSQVLQSSRTPWALRHQGLSTVPAQHRGQDCSALQGCGDAATAPQSCAGPNIPSLLGSFWVRASGVCASPLLSA